MGNNLIVLTGPPCAGKSSILQEIERLGIIVVQEIQMQVIAEYKKLLGGEEKWKNWLKPDRKNIDRPHFYEFMNKCIERQIRVERLMAEQSQDEKKIVVFDRSVLDGLTFLELRDISNSRHIQLQVAKHIRSIGGYAGVFHLSILPDEFEKRKQEGRVITIEEAQKFDTLNRSIYQQYGYTGMEFISRRAVGRDAQSIREAIHTIGLAS